MHAAEHEIYKRWIDKWTPHLVYGASAGGAGSPAAAAQGAPPRRPVSVSQLPGMQIVGA